MNKLVKYLSVILKWRRFLFWNTFGLTLLATVVSFVLPQRFTATAQLLPPSDEGEMFGLSGVLSGGISSRLGRLRATALGGSGAADVTVAILESRTIVRAVAERCSVARYYRIRPDHLDEVEKQLRSMTTVTAGDEGVVRISVEARTRQLAANLANTYLAELDTFLRRSNISRGRSLRIFVERRLTQVESSLAVARESLRVFQQHHRVATVDNETKAAIDVYARMRSQLSTREAELEAAKMMASDDNPYVVGLKQEISALRTELDKLERGDRLGGYGVGFGVSFEHFPTVAAEFARRYQNVRIQEEAYAALYQQYEYAKILEVRDTPVLTVLDYAVPPMRRSFPRRTLIVLVVMCFSLILGISFAFTAEYFAYLRSERPDEYRAWSALRNDLASVAVGLKSRFRKQNN